MDRSEHGPLSRQCQGEGGRVKTQTEGIQEGLRDSMVICQILLGFKQDTTEESLVAEGVMAR